MLKFFRQIRKKLLAEDKLKKYLIYASGEILLVMPGILLALQVNNWNQEGKYRISERELFIGIKEELSLKPSIRKLLHEQLNQTGNNSF